MIKTPHFSIITVTYNNLEGLHRTYESLIEQSTKDYQWIVIDGGSEDGTVAFLSGLDLGNLEWVSAPDLGIYDAMNKGIAYATGTYIQFLNAGDVLAGRETVETVSKYQGDIIYGDAMEGVEIKYAYDPFLYKAALFTHHQSIFYKRELLGALRYNLDYEIAADYLLTQIYLTHCDSVSYISFPLCIFEQGGISQKQAVKGRMELYDIRRKYKICSGFENILMFMKQSVTGLLKHFAPQFYWRFRSFRRAKTLDA